MGILDSVALQGAEVVGIAQFIPHLSEDVDAALGPLLSECTFNMTHEIRDDMIVVKQGVIYIMEKGVMVLLAGATVIRLLPPLVITRGEIDRVLVAMKEVLT
jgi:hypothetical protein